MTFTEVWDTVAREFPNSLTSDSTSITEALEIYGRKATGGVWILKEEIRVSLTRHSELIALLAKIGAARGHDIWIGQREQRETVSGLVEEIKLRDLVTAKLTALKGVKNLRPVLDMDLLWLDGNEVIRAFEVECTTTMTSGLQRGSNLPATVPKTMGRTVQGLHARPGGHGGRRDSSGSGAGRERREHPAPSAGPSRRDAHRHRRELADGRRRFSYWLGLNIDGTLWAWGHIVAVSWASVEVTSSTPTLLVAWGWTMIGPGGARAGSLPKKTLARIALLLILQILSHSSF